MGVTNFDKIQLDKAKPIVADNAVDAAGSAPTKAEFDAVVALVNEMKQKLNAIFKG